MWREGKFGILVVDDEKSVLTTYALILQRQGYAVQTAISSVEAKKILDEKDFDLLLCDYSLEQEHTGFEVIDHARRKSPALKAALLTGYASKETADLAVENDIQVLYKPIDIQEFFRTVAALLEKDNVSNEKEKAGEEKGSSTENRRQTGSTPSGKPVESPAGRRSIHQRERNSQ